MRRTCGDLGRAGLVGVAVAGVGGDVRGGGGHDRLAGDTPPGRVIKGEEDPAVATLQVGAELDISVRLDTASGEVLGGCVTDTEVVDAGRQIADGGRAASRLVRRIGGVVRAAGEHDGDN